MDKTRGWFTLPLILTQAAGAMNKPAVMVQRRHIRLWWLALAVIVLVSVNPPPRGWASEMQAALIKAIESNDVAAARAAIERGADVNRPGPFHRTVLHRAAYYSPDSIVEWLLARGADPNAKDDAGRTPLHLASGGATARLLLQAKADPSMRDAQGNTALHAAAELPHPDAAEVLVRAGLSVDVRNHAGLTPLHFAALQGNRQTAGFLLDQDADINAATTRDYHHRWTYIGWDVQGSEELVPGGTTPIAYARRKHRAYRWVNGQYQEFADYLAGRGAIERKWWQFWP